MVAGARASAWKFGENNHCEKYSAYQAVNAMSSILNSLCNLHLIMTAWAVLARYICIAAHFCLAIGEVGETLFSLFFIASNYLHHRSKAAALAAPWRAWRNNRYCRGNAMRRHAKSASPVSCCESIAPSTYEMKSRVAFRSK